MAVDHTRRSPSSRRQIMAQDIGVPFHAGAAKWYKEQGVTVN